MRGVTMSFKGVVRLYVGMLILFMFSPTFAQVTFDIVKRTNKALVKSGEEFYYTIEFEASSTTDQPINVTVTDTLPPELLYIGSQGNDQYTDDGTYDSASHSVTWVVNSNFQVGTTVQVYVDVKFPHGITCGGIETHNTAFIDADNAEKTASNTVTVTSDEPIVWNPVGKSIRDMTECPPVGGQALYSYIVDFPGYDTRLPMPPGFENLNDWTIRAYLPENAVFKSSNWDRRVTYHQADGNYVEWSIGSWVADPEDGSHLGGPGNRWVGQGLEIKAYIEFPSAHFTGGQAVSQTMEFSWNRACRGDTSFTLQIDEEMCDPQGWGQVNKQPNVPLSEFFGRSVYVGQIHSWSVSASNPGNGAITNAALVDTLPPALQYVKSVEFINITETETWIYAEYKTNKQDFREYPGSPVKSRNSWGQGYTGLTGALGLDADEYITAIRARPVDGQMLPAQAIHLIYHTSVQSPDREGNTWVTDDRVENCAYFHYDFDQTSHTETACASVKLIEPFYYASLNVSPDKDTYEQGEQMTTNLLVQNVLPHPIPNPVTAILLPEGVKYVSWTGNQSSGTGLGDPRIEELPNYNNTGRDLIRWRWDGANDDTLEYNHSYTIEIVTDITGETTNGTHRFKYHLVEPENAYASRHPHPTSRYEDENDLNGNGSVTDNIIGSGYTVTVRGPASSSGVKQIKSVFHDHWTQYPDYSWTVKNHYFDSRLVIENTGETPLIEFVIYDILPHPGDTEVTSTSARGSVWQPSLAELISAPTGVEIQYSTEGNPDRPELNVSGNPPNWTLNPPDLSAVKSLRIHVDQKINPGERFEMTFRMMAPEQAPFSEVAWNSFGYTAYDNLEWLLPTEPNKVGIQIGESTLSKSNGVDEVSVGSQVTYTLDYTAPIDLTQALVVDTLAECFEYVSSIPEGQYDQNTHTVTWTLENLTRAETGQLSVTVRIAADCAAEEVTNSAEFYAIDPEDTKVPFDQTTDTDVLLKYGTIGDKVWLDHNGDGVQDPGEEGLPGIDVQLLDSQGNVVMTRTTNSQGLYLFENVPPGSYSVHIDNNSLPANHNLTGGSDPHEVELSPAEEYLDADFGYQPAPGLVGDYVWYDDNGDGVQDEDETGITNVSLILLQVTQTEPLPEQNPGENPPQDAPGTSVLPVDTIATDEQGRYQFSNVSPGTYQVTVDPATLPEHHTLTGGTDPHSLTLGPGQSYLTADFGYQPDPGTIGDMIWIDMDGDGVYDSDEAGFEGAVIYLIDNQGDTVAQTLSNSDGEYKFENVRPGDYTVVVDEGKFNRSYYRSAGDNPHAVSLSPGEEYWDADFGYKPVSTVGDRVWFDQDQDGRQDPQEPGIEGVVLRLFDESGKLVAKALTRENGQYEFKNVVPGCYTVKVDESTVPDEYFSVNKKSPIDICLDEFEIYHDADFGYGSGEAFGCGNPVLAWYEAWYASLQSDSTLRHWDTDRLGGMVDSALFEYYYEYKDMDDSTRPALYDSNDPYLWEYQILLAWAADIDAFVVDWYGMDAYEQSPTRGLLNAADRLWEKYGQMGFDFRIIVSYNAQSIGSLESNLQFISDSLMSHPAYYNQRELEQGNPFGLIHRPLFVLDENSVLDPQWFMQKARVLLPVDAEVIWNWDANRTDLQDTVDSVYPWVSSSFDWGATDGLNWGERYLNEFYSTWNSLGVDYVTGAVWPGFDDRQWILGESRWMSRQDTVVYDSTWQKAVQNTPYWILVQSWNDYNQGSHIELSHAELDTFIFMTRNRAISWKGGRDCAHNVNDLGMTVPEVIYNARKTETLDILVEQALYAFFQRDYAGALSILEPKIGKGGALEPLQGIRGDTESKTADNQLVFVQGSATYQKGNDVRGWNNLVDGDLTGWEGTTMARGDESVSDPAWAVFGFTDDGLYQFNYVQFVCDNGTKDNGNAYDYRCTKFRILVSTSGTLESDFEPVATIDRKYDGTETEFFGLGRYVKARYIKIELLQPNYFPGGWRQMVEFNVTTEEKKGAVPANENGGFKLATEMGLEQNYPNPFNPETTIQYSLDQQVRVSLVVYDMLGRPVATLVEQVQQAGSYQVVWSAADLPSGTYFYHFRAGEFQMIKRMTLIK